MAQIQKQYYLRELLQQDQEPFLLKNYIADHQRNYNLKKTSPKSIISHKTSNFRSNFTKNACFFSFHDVDTLKKSPMFQAAVPVRQSKTRNQNKGLFGFSFLKRLTLTLRENISSAGGRKRSDKNIDEAILGLSCSSCSVVWSESNNNEDYKSTLDFDLESETSSSSSSQFEYGVITGDDEEKRFCESPFRFVLQSESSSPAGRRTPEFLSPVTSPAPTIKQDKEEDEEQCSPVSVLDPPFEDDDDDRHSHELDEENDDYNIESSFAMVQRAKQKLLRKLHQFERLAGLDPIELEKRMSEQLQEDDDDEYDNIVHEESLIDDDQESNISPDSENDVKQVLSKSSFRYLTKISVGMKKLVSDLLAEEQKDSSVDSNLVVKRVCERLESWKDVEFNTINMMVEQDFKSEVDESSKRNQEHVEEIATEIELAIFRILVQEVSEEN